MKLNMILISVVLVPFLAGCSTTRPIADIGFGAAGAAIANEFSKGDPALTAVGAAGGVLISEGLHFAAKQQSERAFTSGYDKGKSDAVKQQYWLLVHLQRQRNGGTDSVRLYAVPVPRASHRRRHIAANDQSLRIEE